MLDSKLTGMLDGFLPGPRTADRIPSDWTDEPYSRFSASPVAPVIGAVIDGVDLAEPLDTELFAQLNRALLEYKVLFFPGQAITDEQQAAFASNWGPLETHPFYGRITGTGANVPELVRLEKDDKTYGFENAWHSGVTWRAEPSLRSVLRAVEVPEVGGDTLWAGMGAAIR